MKKSKLIVSVSIIVVIIAAAVIINSKVFDFYTPISKWVKETVPAVGERDQAHPGPGTTLFIHRMSSSVGQ